LEAAEVDFLLDTLQPFVAKKLDKQQVKAGFGGLRPLLVGDAAQTESLDMANPLAAKKPKSTKRLLRDHEVEYDVPSGLLSLLGGKWTTYRLMARDAVDVAGELLGQPAQCTTAGHLLVGAAGFVPDDWQKLAAAYGFDAVVARHLHQKYGNRANRVGDLVQARPALAARLHPDYPFIQAEVVYAVHNEMAGTLRDFLARRIRLEMMDWQAVQHVIPLVAELMGKELGWSPAMVLEFAHTYHTLVQHFSNRLSFNLSSNHGDNQ